MIDESTKEERFQAAQEMKEKWEQTPCPMCGETKWTSVANNIKIDIEVPVLSYYCNCGYLALYMIHGSIEAFLKMRKEAAMSVQRSSTTEED